MASEARAVTIAGDFNGWNPASVPMKKRPDGAWFVQLELSHGHHHYLFYIDGKPALDPKAQGIGRNHRNERVSMVAVS